MTDQLKIVIVGSAAIGEALMAGVALDVDVQVWENLPEEQPYDLSVMGLIDSFRFIESPGHYNRIPKPVEDWQGKGKHKKRRLR